MIFVAGLILEEIASNIQIDGSFCKESHLRTICYILVHSPEEDSILVAWNPNRNKISFQRVTGCSAQIEQPWAQRIIAFFKASFWVKYIEWQWVIFFSLSNVAISVFFLNMWWELKDLEIHSPHCKANLSKWAVRLFKNWKQGTINNLGQNNPWA